MQDLGLGFGVQVGAPKLQQTHSPEVLWSVAGIPFMSGSFPK